MCLRDTGCTTIVANSKIVEEGDYDGKKDTLTMADGTRVECPTATLNINSPWFEGTVRARVLKDAFCDLIIGNIDGVIDNSEEMLRQWCESKYQLCATIQTRATTKRKEKEEIDLNETIQIGSKEMSNQEL